MKIVPDRPLQDPAWLAATFTVTMTGEELLRLWKLSYSGEGGEVFPRGRDDAPADPDTGHERFIYPICRALGLDPEIARSVLRPLLARMSRGRVR